jgi:formamidopyrimidine-DNA glycosylase
MPELPEVETVRRGLARWVVGRTIADVDVHHPRAVRRHLGGPQDFIDLLIGRTIEDALRRGKYLWLPLDSGDALVAHLGMSGQLLIVEPGTPAEAHLRVRFTFADGGPELRFVDQRTFGGLSVAAGGAALATGVHGPTDALSTDTPPTEAPSTDAPPARPADLRTGRPLPESIAHIAADPLDPAFSEEEFIRALRRRTTGLKRALLDQNLISGVGNIYADEALWRARLHWGRATRTMTRRQAVEVLAAVREVLDEAIEAGGTSFDSLYVNVNGQSGYFDRSLNVYGREGEPCPRCGTPIRRDKWMNRSAYTCPVCQPRPRHPL